MDEEENIIKKIIVNEQKNIITNEEKSMTDEEKNIRNMLQKYEDILLDYKYIPSDKIYSMNIKSHIIYFSKKDCVKKSGYLKAIRHETILELNCGRRPVYIYQNNYYIFNIDKKKRNNKMKVFLQKMLSEDFSSLTITPKE